MATVEITKDNFRDLYESSDILIVDFWASWCQPCLAFAPTYEEASEKHSDIVFGKVDTEQQPELSAHFSIRSIPTIMVIREGIEVFFQPGSLSGDDLAHLIQEVKKLDMEEVKKKVEEEDANLD